jgi:phage shock protein A
MADGVFTRLTNLWRGFISLWVSGIEKEHPEIAYENAINSMIERYSALKKATAAIIRRREDTSQQLDSAQTELAQVTQDLNAAIETHQDDLGVVLVQKKNQLEAQLAELNTDSVDAGKDADSAKAALMQVQADIKRLKAEKDQMLAKFQSAKARIRIQESLDGLSVDAEVKALDNVRENIKNTVAEAKLGKELHESSLDERLAALRGQGVEVTARQQFDQMKAAAAAKKAAVKTL